MTEVGARCIIMRGLPGSGKSTLADEIADEFITAYEGDHDRIAAILSTDGYFTDDDGYYDFNMADLPNAHKWNIKNAATELFDYQTPLVIIDNTNTRKWEALPYVLMATAAGYTVEIRETETEWKTNIRELVKRNTHGVPLFALINMRKRWETDFTIDAIKSADVPVLGQEPLAMAKKLIKDYEEDL